MLDRKHKPLFSQNLSVFCIAKTWFQLTVVLCEVCWAAVLGLSFSMFWLWVVGPKDAGLKVSALWFRA